MKTSILSLALGVMLVSFVAAYADERRNVIEDLLHGLEHNQRASRDTTDSQWRDPFKPRTTNGLSSNPDACVSYGCVGAGGGGD
jgi:hypothetical protein